MPGVQPRFFPSDLRVHDERGCRMCNSTAQKQKLAKDILVPVLAQAIEKAGARVWTCRSNSNDRYGRALASCEMDNTNLNRWLVRSGWALSFTRYSHEYDGDESIARGAKAGLWSGAFIAPWDWRGRNSKTEILGAVSVPKDAQSILLSAASAVDAPIPQCAVKGNVTRKGECIYHLPGGRYYSAVNMDASKGKRWFCSAAEAEAAGCRRSKL